MNSRLRMDVFTTCPPIRGGDGETYRREVLDVARWSEAAGCRGALVYTDNSLLDPWLLAQSIMDNTCRFAPLVAIQPVYMHPYTVAKMIASLGYLYRRRIYLNMVAGGFSNDLAALNDTTPHDRRYARLIEYTSIIKMLLCGGPVTFRGEFYTVDKLRLTPTLPPELFPGILLSGSSDAGLQAARALEAVAIKYPKPPEEEEPPAAPGVRCGIRVGVIARPSAEEAWAIGLQRFPEDRKGQITHQLAMKVSDSVWHRQLSKEEANGQVKRSPYWLGPFQNYKTFCPYLVGSYEDVARELGRYLALGHETLILDVPPSPDELEHTNRVLRMAVERLQHA